MEDVTLKKSKYELNLPHVKKWREKNKEKIKEYNREYQKKYRIKKLEEIKQMKERLKELENKNK